MGMISTPILPAIPNQSVELRERSEQYERDTARSAPPILLAQPPQERLDEISQHLKTLVSIQEKANTWMFQNAAFAPTLDDKLKSLLKANVADAPTLDDKLKSFVTLYTKEQPTAVKANVARVEVADLVAKSNQQVDQIVQYVGDIAVAKKGTAINSMIEAVKTVGEKSVVESDNDATGTENTSTILTKWLDDRSLTSMRERNNTLRPAQQADNAESSELHNQGTVAPRPLLPIQERLDGITQHLKVLVDIQREAVSWMFRNAAFVLTLEEKFKTFAELYTKEQPGAELADTAQVEIAALVAKSNEHLAQLVRFTGDIAINKKGTAINGIAEAVKLFQDDLNDINKKIDGGLGDVVDGTDNISKILTKLSKDPSTVDLFLKKQKEESSAQPSAQQPKMAGNQAGVREKFNDKGVDSGGLFKTILGAGAIGAAGWLTSGDQLLRSMGVIQMMLRNVEALGKVGQSLSKMKYIGALGRKLPFISLFFGIFDGISGFVEEFSKEWPQADTASKKLRAFSVGVGGAAKKIIGSFVFGTLDLIKSLGSWVTELLFGKNDFSDWLDSVDLEKWWTELNIADSINKFVNDMWDSMIGWVKGMASKVINFFTGREDNVEKSSGRAIGKDAAGYKNQRIEAERGGAEQQFDKQIDKDIADHINSGEWVPPAGEPTWRALKRSLVNKFGQDEVARAEIRGQIVTKGFKRFESKAPITIPPPVTGVMLQEGSKMNDQAKRAGSIINAPGGNTTVNQNSSTSIANPVFTVPVSPAPMMPSR